MTNWQPIETAPQDGSCVIVYAAPYYDLPGFVTAARYHPDFGWCVGELRIATHWMSHWMPFPDPPKEGE